MTPRASDMQAQLSRLRHELELSTFLNKGILQSNAEYKLRIAELEKENALLRAAEKKLSSTEDALEASEKRVKAVEAERNAAQREARRLAGSARDLETEKDGWKVRFEAVSEYWRSVLRGMEDVVDVSPPHAASGHSAKSDPLVSRPARKSRSTHAAAPAAGPSAPPSRRAKAHEAGKDRQPGAGDHNDSSPAARPGSSRKRQRLSTTPELEAEASPSVSPPRRRSEPRKPRASHGTSKYRPLSPSRSRKLSDDIVLRPKVEPVSLTFDSFKPGAADAYDDSEDDPLAMN